MSNENQKNRDGHWSDCSLHNAPAFHAGSCDCGGLNLAAYDAYRRITSLIPTPGALTRFVENGILPGLVETEEAPTGGFSALTATTDLEGSHDGIVGGGGSDSVDLYNTCESVIGDGKSLAGIERITRNVPPHNTSPDSSDISDNKGDAS